MPQVDLETLVSACAGASCDRKIACETIAAAIANSEHHHLPDDSDTDPPDLPPESFWLSKDAELDWFDRNAFIERKDSAKGNSINLNTHINPGHNPNPSNSQRFSASLKAKPSIFSLPKPQNSCFVDAKNRRACKLGSTRLFPRRSGSSGKSESALVEPSSPKVSCMGRVRSKRDRNKRLKNRQKAAKSHEPERKCRNSESKTERQDSGNKTGFLSSIRAIFRSGHRQSQLQKRSQSRKKDDDASSGGVLSTIAAVRTSDIRDRLPARDRDALTNKSHSVKPVETGAEPAGLGGMTRFSSGRRSDAFVAGVDMA